MDNRLESAFEALIDQMEDPPTWEEITTHEVRPSSRSPGMGRWPAFAAGVAGVLVIGLVAILVVGDRPGGAATVPYVRIDWNQTVEMRCEGMETVDNGGFDSAILEIWGPTEEGRYRMDATAPDGTVEQLVVDVDDAGNPIRSWSSLSRFNFDEETFFRVSECDTGTGNSYSMAQPPYYPWVGEFPLEFSRFSRALFGRDSVDVQAQFADDFESRQGEWRDQPVTVFASSHSGADELGTFRQIEEWWVDIDDDRLERRIIDVDQEVIGRLQITMETSDRAESPARNVSFATDDLELGYDRPEFDTPSDEDVVVTTSIVPTAEPLMEGAEEIGQADIPTSDLRDVISPESGDQLFRTPVDDFEVLVRLRAGERPHIYATSCDVLALVDLPAGWEGTCLERTIDGERHRGIFPYGTASE